MNKKVIMIIHFIAGAILIYTGFAIFTVFKDAAQSIVEPASDLSTLASKGGQTMDEVYYQSMGSIYLQLIFIIKYVGYFFSVILSFFGYKEIMSGLKLLK